MQKLIILGAGVFAGEVIWLVEDINREADGKDRREIIGLLDQDPQKQDRPVRGYPVRGEWRARLEGTDWYAVASVGTPRLREHLAGLALEQGCSGFANLLHPRATVSPRVKMGTGIVVMPGAVISVEVELGEHVLVNKLCSIGHDVKIGRCAVLAPLVAVGGGAVIGEGCSVGMNATLLPGVRLGEGSRVGAGSVVNRDIPPHRTAVGVPARVVSSEVR